MSFEDMADDDYQVLARRAFEDAGLEEIDESQLEPGTYTNAQITEMMRGDPDQLVFLLTHLPTGAGAGSMRSILSFAVDEALDD